MMALIRYYFAIIFHSQRYLLPVLLFLTVLMVSAINDTGPLAALYALGAGAMMCAATWLTVALINSEDATHRSVILVSAGSAARLLVATILTVGIGCAFLTAVGLLFPLLAGNHTITADALLTGFESYFVSVSVGVAIGLICSRLVISRFGYALVAAFVLFGVLLFVRGIPPVNTLLRLMVHNPQESMAVSGFWSLLISLAVLLISLLVTQKVSARRD